MRTAVLFNFLIESGIIASVGILLLLVARRVFRNAIGSRAILFGWLLVAVRLLCPLVLPNPLINEIRPPAVRDWGIRPIAAQVKVRIRDFTRSLYYATRQNGRLSRWLGELTSAQYSAGLSRWLFGLWVLGMIAALAWFIIRWARQKGEWRRELIPALCCAIHWFNPLVWLAWRICRSDALLAKAQTGARKPLGMIFAALASVLLVCAFATGEYTAPMSTADSLPAQTAALPASASDEAIIARIRELCLEPGFQPAMAEAEWTVNHLACGYSLYAEKDGVSCRAHLLPDGRLAFWYASREREAFDHFGIAQRASDAQSEEVARYTLALMDRLSPGTSSLIEAFEDATTETGRDGSVMGFTTGVTFAYQGQEHPGVSLTCMMEPEVEVIHYVLEPPLLQHLWKTELEPLPSRLTDTLCGFPAAQDEGSPPPAPGQLSAEAAFEKALEHIRTKYGETDRSLRRFEASYRLNAEGEPSRWYFHLKSLVFGGLYSDGYEVALDAQTGEILFCYGMDEGNG